MGPTVQLSAHPGGRNEWSTYSPGWALIWGGGGVRHTSHHSCPKSAENFASGGTVIHQKQSLCLKTGKLTTWTGRQRSLRPFFPSLPVSGLEVGRTSFTQWEKIGPVGRRENKIEEEGGVELLAEVVHAAQVSLDNPSDGSEVARKHPGAPACLGVHYVMRQNVN